MNICLVGSLPPYKDGIADHNYYLFKNIINLNTDRINILPSLDINMKYPDEFEKYIINYSNTDSKKIDLYHLQFGNSYPNSFVFKVFNKIKYQKAKIVVTLHDTTNTNLAKVLRTLRSDPKKLIYEFNKPSFKEIVFRADKIVVYSNFLKQYLEDKYNIRNKIVVSYIGANFTSNQIKAYKENKNQYVITSYGSVTPRKGYEEVIKSLNKLKLENINFKYYIIGSFNFVHYRIQLEYLINRYKLNNNVFLLGYMPMNEIIQNLEKSDVIIQPRLYSNEGASASLATALLSGTAVITTEIGSLSEYIVNRQTGLLVKHSSVEYSKALIELFNNIKLRQILGLHGKSWAIKNLTWQKIAEKHYELYLKLR